tara:strand:+ start:795 stop:941 length:147 start_codon:yes stop_codon:yes gene_type:complete
MNFKETLPNDIEELKDIIELQLETIKSLQDKLDMFNGKFTQVNFLKRD